MSRAHGNKPVPYGKLAISAGFTIGALLLNHSAFHSLDPSMVFQRLAWPMTRLMAFIAIGLAAGQLLEGLGWTRRLSILARPIFSVSRIGDHCGAAFTTAFMSGAAANAMLLEFYESGKISKAQLFLANYLNHFPAFFLHLPTTMFIVLPLTGTAGVWYFALTFAATLVRVLLVMAAGRLFLPEPGIHMNEGATQAGQRIKGKDKKASLGRAILKRLPGRVIRIFIWVLPIYTLVFLFSLNGVFDALNTALSRYLVVNFMPVESLSVVILSFAAEFTSGFAAAGALLNEGVLTVKQTVIALLAGNILAFPLRAIRHQLPRYMGIFSPKLGLQLLLSGQCFRIVSLILTGLIYYWMV